MADTIETKHTAAGLAALSICESLLLALGDLGVLSKKDLIGILDDAAAVHRNAGTSAQDAVLHLEAAAIVERIMAGRNPLPLP